MPQRFVYTKARSGSVLRREDTNTQNPVPGGNISLNMAPASWFWFSFRKLKSFLGLALNLKKKKIILAHSFGALFISLLLTQCGKLRAFFSTVRSSTQLFAVTVGLAETCDRFMTTGWVFNCTPSAPSFRFGFGWSKKTPV